METRNQSEKMTELQARIIKKMEAVSERSKNKIPYTAEGGVHDDKAIDGPGGIDWWTNGFWGGMLWLMYQETGEERYARTARISEDKLDVCFEKYYGLDHDVGFLWQLTAVADYRLTKNPESRKRGLHAANILAGRFNPAGNFIRVWNDGTFGAVDNTGWAIIDCMMNLALLYWASEETGDPRYRLIAMAHADTVMNTFVRPDGSVCHIVEYDSCTGERVCDYRGQGYEQGSAWTRGQCWAIYGFALSYLHTGKKEYLETAEKAADHFIKNIPEDYIIPVDFCQPKDAHLQDDSAASIAASAFLLLAEQVPEDRAGVYRDTAEKLLLTLAEKSCNWDESADNFLEKCTAAYWDDKHHFPIIYGDYFFIEAVLRFNGSEWMMW